MGHCCQPFSLSEYILLFPLEIEITYFRNLATVLMYKEVILTYLFLLKPSQILLSGGAKNRTKSFGSPRDRHT